MLAAGGLVSSRLLLVERYSRLACQRREIGDRVLLRPRVPREALKPLRGVKNGRKLRAQCDGFAYAATTSKTLINALHWDYQQLTACA